MLATDKQVIDRIIDRHAVGGSDNRCGISFNEVKADKEIESYLTSNLRDESLDVKLELRRYFDAEVRRELRNQERW